MGIIWAHTGAIGCTVFNTWSILGYTLLDAYANGAALLKLSRNSCCFTCWQRSILYIMSLPLNVYTAQVNNDVNAFRGNLRNLL